MVCESKNCDKEYASKGGMKNHFKKSHKAVEEIQSPLGRFPSVSNSARVLFNDEELPSTQGNSAGQVNSPKIVSEARFLCDECETVSATKVELTNHKKEVHEKSSEENDITENAVIASELEDMVRKVRLIYNQDCHDCNMREEVVKSKEELLVKKDMDIEILERRVRKTDEKKKDLEKDIKKLRQNESEHKKEIKHCLDMLEESNSKVATLTAELATKSSMEEVSNDEDRHEQRKCDHCDFNSRNEALFEAHMKFRHRPTTQNVCNACDMICSTNDELELHLVEEHEDEIDCVKCNAVFKKEADVYNRSNSACSEIIPLNTCNKCERDIVSKAALNRHVKSCKGKKQTDMCRNGDNCSWYRYNKCKFVHLNHKKNQQPKQQHQNKQRQQQQPPHPWQQQTRQLPRQQHQRQQQQPKPIQPQQFRRQQPRHSHQHPQDWQIVQNRRRKDINCKWGSANGQTAHVGSITARV